MHSHIGIFAYAKTKEEAEEKILERVQDQTDGEHDSRLWDYFTSYKEDHARWGLKPATLVSECRMLVDKLQESTQENYKYHVKKLTETINKSAITDEEKDRKQHDVIMWSYLLSSPNQYHLFTPDGETIRNKHDFDCVLSKYKSIYEDQGKPNPLKDFDIYIMDFDVHY